MSSWCELRCTRRLTALSVCFDQINVGIADGSIDILIGTHALISESVQFNSLGLAIVDEQHR